MAENCMKEFGPGEGASLAPPLDPPLALPAELNVDLHQLLTAHWVHSSLKGIEIKCCFSGTFPGSSEIIFL